MHTDSPSDTKHFTLVRLLAVIAVVATLSALAPWQAAPATPQTATPPRASVPFSPRSQAFRQRHPEFSEKVLSEQVISEQPRDHLIPTVGIKP